MKRVLGMMMMVGMMCTSAFGASFRADDTFTQWHPTVAYTVKGDHSRIIPDRIEYSVVIDLEDSVEAIKGDDDFELVDGSYLRTLWEF